MSTSDSVFNNLRQKLDIMGYRESLPLAGIPLVGKIFEDLIKSTESLRDAKKQLMVLLEEKSCWELGVEPYKCDNSRLMQQCNQLHSQFMRQQEESEEKICELNTKLRDLQLDKLHLQQQCEQLQQQLQLLKYKCQQQTSSSNMRKELKPKKPFVSTVRSHGDQLPPALPLHELHTNSKCSKCQQSGYSQKVGDCSCGPDKIRNQKELERLENSNIELIEHIKFCQRKIEARDREILRLNDLLSGGRPVAALARDCCYKNFGSLNEDLNLMQKDKLESLTRMREYQDKMHDAMQKALDLEKSNKSLQKQLDELKDAALMIEHQANNEVAQRESEVESLKKQLRDAQMKSNSKNPRTEEFKKPEANKTSSSLDKHKFNEKINELTQKEVELRETNERLQKKIHKLKHKMHSIQKELKDVEDKHTLHLDEEKIRLKSERDFFQKEYLRLLNKAGSEKEIEFLQAQIKSKDEELAALRSQLYCKQQNQQALVPCHKDNETMRPMSTCGATSTQAPISSARSYSSTSSDCVQAMVLRVERERDCARVELERVRCERDSLKEKLLCTTKLNDEQMHRTQERYNELNGRLKELEKENRTLQTTRMPIETQVVLLREEIEAYKEQNYQLREERSKIQGSYDTLRMLHQQTERSLSDYQCRLRSAESQLEASKMNLNTMDSNRETSRQEVSQLRSEVKVIKQTYAALENEKDKLLMQLDTKTETAYKLEYELKACMEKRIRLEEQVKDLEEELSKLSSKTRELHETSSESKTLRQQLNALKTSRDQAIQENKRLTKDLAESQAEISILKKQLKDSEKEIERLKKQLTKYVEEVKKAEDLLLQKEKEREEMLEHYRSLSHDAVALEGNNQSLENEAAEQKRQITELENEISSLKRDLAQRNCEINQLEDKLTTLTTQNTCLEHKLEEALDDQRLLKIDLEARKELCDKLDVQKDRLNAELSELNDIKRKLEVQIDKLRSEMNKTERGQKMSSETLEELLSRTRRDLEDQIKVDSKLSLELVRLRKQNEHLLNDLDQEKQKRKQQETLAREYQVQNQELRHNLTDDRFQKARSREQSPRYPLATL